MAKEQGEERRPRIVSAGYYDGRMLLRHVHSLFAVILVAEDPTRPFSNPSIAAVYGIESAEM